MHQSASSVLILFFCLTLPRVCSSEASPRNLQRQQNEILQKEFQRQRAKEESRRLLTPPQRPTKDINLASETFPSHLSFTFQSIFVEGVTVFSNEEIESFLRNFRKTPVSLDQINTLVRYITNAYVDKGYITSRVYVPPQNLTKGLLKIKVVEGVLSKIMLLEKGTVDTEKPGRNIAFPGLTGHVLNLRDLEQGLDQINRLSNLSAKLDLTPGSDPGESSAKVVIEQQKSWKISSSLDNSGSQQTGRHRADLGLVLENLLGFYEDLHLTVQQDIGKDEKVASSRSLSASFSVPYGYWTFRLSSHYFSYLMTVKGQSQDFRPSGSSWNHTGEIERLLHRDGVSKTSLAVFLSLKGLRSYVEETLIQVGTRKQSSVGLRLAHSRRLLSGVASASLTYEQGLRSFGALKDDDAFPKAPKAQFKKGQASLGYLRPFRLGTHTLTWSCEVLGQWSADSLYASDQIGLGGPTTVRGFWDQTLSGDVGGFFRTELAWSLLSWWDNNFLTKADLFTGFDMGWIRKESSNPYEGGQLQGFTIGLRARSENFFADISWEKPLKRPSFFQPENRLIRFKAGLVF